jgi:hypothetical protein
MWVNLTACLVIVFSSLSYAQAGNNPENVIKRMITTGFFEGHDEKVINSMGDSAAVVLTKILAGGEPNSTNIEMSLLVLQSSFADPRSIENPNDKQPRTALFVLKSMERYTQDVALKKRIADTTQYVKDKYASSLRGSQN